MCPGNDLFPVVPISLTLFLTSQGPEHTMRDADAPPSNCTLELFHTPLNTETAPPGPGYVSNDGHHFTCKKSGPLRAAFHV